MNNCNPPVVRDLGMGIFLSHSPVGCPPGMSDAFTTLQIQEIQSLLDFEDFSNILLDLKFRVRIKCKNARRIVTSVLETLQPFNENRCGGFLSVIGNDSTHSGKTNS